MTKKTRRRFTPEYKEQAVTRLSEPGVTALPTCCGPIVHLSVSAAPSPFVLRLDYLPKFQGMRLSMSLCMC